MIGRVIDVFIDAVENLGLPVMTLTAANSRVAAFYNSCLHRGTQLAPAGSAGTVGEFRCPYHGWRYALDGVARSIGVLGNAAEVMPALVARGFTPDVITDQTSAHDPLVGRPAGRKDLDHQQHP